MDKLRLFIYIIVIIFLIQCILIFIDLCNGIYKYFILSELNLKDRYQKSWVVITGASSGQGRDFALEFASRGFNILMIGSKRTIETENIIKKQFPTVKTKIIYKDFRKAFDDNFFTDIDNVFKELNIEIGILINNVGYRTGWNPYHKMPVELIKDTITIGTIVQSRLTQMVIPYFLQRREKGINSALVNITAQCMHNNFLFGITMSNEISVPYLSVYEASNAFGFYHGNSIYKEYKNQFDILNITPGAVITNNTEYLSNTFFNVKSDYFVKQVIKMMGQIQGHTCAYWGHAFSNYLINLAPFMKNYILENVGYTISKNYMNEYAKKSKSY